MAFSIAQSLAKGKELGSSVKSQYDKLYPTKNSNLKLGDLTSLDRPANTWRWSCIFPTINGLTLDQMKCESIELPLNVTFATTERFIGGINQSFANAVNYEVAVAEFYETEDYSTTAYFLEWQNMIFNPKTRDYGLPGDYMQSITFTLLPIVELGTKEGHAQVVFGNCYPSSIGKFQYNSETGRIKVRVDFTIQEIFFTSLQGPKAKTGWKNSDVASVLQKALKWRA